MSKSGVDAVCSTKKNQKVHPYRGGSAGRTPISCCLRQTIHCGPCEGRRLARASSQGPVAMEGVHYQLDTPAQFWGELDEIIAPVAAFPRTDIDVQSVVRSFVRFAAAFRGTPLSPHDISGA